MWMMHTVIYKYTHHPKHDYDAGRPFFAFSVFIVVVVAVVALVHLVIQDLKGIKPLHIIISDQSCRVFYDNGRGKR
jgi:hypothetical protein